MNRRHVLKLGGVALAGITASGVGSADGDADPRPEPQGGTVPNKNVPTRETGALGPSPFNEPSTIPVGYWIHHSNGWVMPDNPELVEEFANKTTQIYTIDDEEFILDGFEDWDYWEESDGTPHLSFDYFTPPKQKGATYEIKWEFEWDSDPMDAFPNWENLYPFSNQIEIVGRN